MDLHLAAKSALITGASKGIGRAAAQALAAEGCNVILVSRSAGDLAATREQIRQSCNVIVNVIGLMKKKAQDRTGSADNWRDLFKPLPFARGCAPQEIGAMIAFLASERCSYNSGSVVTIDAGLSARSVNF